MLDSGPVGEERQPQQLEAAGLLQVLATEHWSLLATRALTYNESLSRVTMFLSVLSGAVIALALVAQADRFGRTFLLIAILVLSVVLFVGVATVARLGRLNYDDMAWVIGMNRIRHAYIEVFPQLERYLVASPHDDARGMALTMGADRSPPRGLGQLAHGVQTLPGMVGLIVSVVAGALGALVAEALDGPTEIAVAAAVAGFSVTAVLLLLSLFRSFIRFRAGLAPRFPREEPAKPQ